jgi:hypothetical protein
MFDWRKSKSFNRKLCLEETKAETVLNEEKTVITRKTVFILINNAINAVK